MSLFGSSITDAFNMAAIGSAQQMPQMQQAPFIKTQEAYTKTNTTSISVEEVANGYVVRCKDKSRICDSVEKLGDVMMLVFQESKMS